MITPVHILARLSLSCSLSVTAVLTLLMPHQLPAYWVPQLWQYFHWFLDICSLKSYLDFNTEYSEKSSRCRPW